MNGKKKPEDYLNLKIQKFEPYSINENITDIEIHLDANESFADLPEYIKEDILKNVKNINSFNRYPDPAAKELIKEYAKYLKISENAEIDIKNIAAGNGTDELLNIIINGFLSKGDKILTFKPDFSMYAFYADVIEANVLKVQKEGSNGFAIDFTEMEEKIKRENIKLVVFSNPCNPTGRLEKKKVLEKFIKNSDIPVILDEVYMSFANEKEKQSFLYDFLKYPNLIILKSLSKAVGLASARVGFALSNEVFINMIKTIKSPYNLNSISQITAKTVLNYPDHLKIRLSEIKNNKKNLEEEIKKLFGDDKEYKIYDTDTNFILIETKKAKEIFGFLFENKILIRNFGENFLRITTGSREENGRLLSCLKKFLQGDS